MFGNRALRKFLQPFIRLAGGKDGYLGAYSYNAGSQSEKQTRVIQPWAVSSCDKLSSPPGYNFGSVLSAPLLAPLLSASSDEEDDTSAEEVPARKGRHLWCLEDSYGYTKGRIFMTLMAFPPY